MGTVRREVTIERSADDVWAVVGDPSTIATWFPGIVECTIDGTTRVITTASGLPLPEEIVTVDPVLRRFQYRVTAPIMQSHLGTIDVFELGPERCLVSYGTDCDPEVMALIIGGAAGAALRELRRRLEHDRQPVTRGRDRRAASAPDAAEQAGEQ